MMRGETPRSSPMRQRERDHSPPATRSIVGASTIQFAEIGLSVTSDSRDPASASSSSCLPVMNSLVVCDVDETYMQPAFTSILAREAIRGDWEGRVSDKDWVSAVEDADSEDDWC